MPIYFLAPVDAEVERTPSAALANGIAPRKQLGSFYTPDDFAAALTKWAINGAAVDVLDPSYGGCSFLRAALDELTRLDVPNPANRLFGTDIDPQTSPATQALRKLGVPRSNLRTSDFLAMAPGRQLPRCSAVVGNPPYIRHHWLPTVDDEPMVALRCRSGLSKRASSWAYFLLHCADFVADGGRMAMILPGAVLFADYAVAVRESLQRSFQSIEFVRLTNRMLDEAQEDTVVLLAAGKRATPELKLPKRPLSVTTVSGLADLVDLLMSWKPPANPAGRSRIAHETLGIPAHRLADLLPRSRAALLAIEEHEHARRLGDVAAIRIGVVTGANAFFVRRTQEIPTSEGVEALPVVRRRSLLIAGSLTADDWGQWVCAGDRASLMVAPPDLALPNSPQFSRLVASGESAGLHLRRHCRSRRPWWSIRDTKVPDAFLPYMGSGPPSLVLNECGALCTNAIHRVYWRDANDSVTSASAFVSSYSSMFQICAILTGRRYGGGVLKIEPTAASQLPIVIFADAIEAQRQILKVLRTGDRGSVTELADELVSGAFGLTSAAARALRDDRDKLRRHTLGS